MVWPLSVKALNTSSNDCTPLGRLPRDVSLGYRWMVVVIVGEFQFQSPYSTFGSFVKLILGNQGNVLQWATSFVSMIQWIATTSAELSFNLQPQFVVCCLKKKKGFNGYHDDWLPSIQSFFSPNISYYVGDIEDMMFFLVFWRLCWSPEHSIFSWGVGLL